MALHLNGYSNFHDLNLDWLLSEMAYTLKKVKEVETWIENWDGSLDELEQKYDTLVQLYTNLLNSNEQFKAEVNAQFAAYQSTVNIQISTFENTVNAQIGGYQSQLNALDLKLDNAINNFSSSLTMVNPFTGEKEPLSNIINMLASFHMADALTAQEYDSKELTAGAYDALQLTAYQYDVQGSLYIS